MDVKINIGDRVLLKNDSEYTNNQMNPRNVVGTYISHNLGGTVKWDNGNINNQYCNHLILVKRKTKIYELWD